jgi:uncharacterized protein (DUF302 family)
MLLVVESKKTLTEVCDAMQAAVQKHKFGVLGTHNLKETMAKKGVAFEGDCIIFEVCNPIQAKRVLEANMEVSTALPCRISVYTDGGQVRLATIKPTQMLAMFQVPGLEAVAREVEVTIAAIMNEAAG